MSRETANTLLFLVAFFSLTTLGCTLLTLNFSLPLLMHDKLYLMGAILFAIMQIVLIAAPFLKDNRYLFLMIPIAYMSSYFSSLIYFIGYLFTNQNHYMKIGIIPGWLTDGSFVLFGTVGLMVLILRCFGYIKERRQGLKTRF